MTGMSDVFAGRVAGLSSIPGWFPSSASTHYHVKNAWYDARAANHRVGFTINETPGYTYYYDYNLSSQISLTQASALYSALLAAISTQKDVSLAITDTSYACTDCYKFEVVQLGPQ